MSKIKTNLLKLPEYLLIIAVLFYYVSASIVFNPIAIGLWVVLVLQIIFKNQLVGILIPSLLILCCCFMLLALFSEFNEFPTFNAEAKQLLFIGLSFFISTMLVLAVLISFTFWDVSFRY